MAISQEEHRLSEGSLKKVASFKGIFATKTALDAIDGGDDPINLPLAIAGSTLYVWDFDAQIWDEVSGGGNIIPDGVIQIGESSFLANNLTVDGSTTSWMWKIGATYENITSEVFAITPPGSGTFRFDTIVGNNSGNYQLVTGTANSTEASAIIPNDPANTIGLVYILSNDTGIQSVVDFAESSFVEFNTNSQGLTPLQRANARNNIQALSKDTNDERTGTLTQNGFFDLLGSFRQVGNSHHVTFNNDTHSQTAFSIKNNRATDPGGIFMTQRGSMIIRAKGDSLTDYYIIRYQGSDAVQRVEINNNGIFAEQRSAAEKYLTRKDELYLTYPTTIGGTGKLNNVALPDGIGQIVFGADVTEVSGINANTDGKETTIWTENESGLILTGQDTDSLADNRFLREVTVLYRRPAKIHFEITGSLNRWVQISGADVQDFNPDQFEINDSSGEFQVLLDSDPTEDSLRFINSGDLYTYLLSFTSYNALAPGYNTTLTQTTDTRNGSFRKVLGRNGYFYAIYSAGATDRFFISKDGLVFVTAGTTGTLDFSDFDISDTGTIILVARDGGTGNIRRSIDGGMTFSTITSPGSYELTSVISIGAGKWASCARTGEVIYSSDDGATWVAGTVTAPAAGSYSFQGIGFSNGDTYIFADDEEDRFQISTDFGAIYTAKNIPFTKEWRRSVYFLGNIVVFRGGSYTSGYIAISSDRGDTWVEKLVPTDSAQELSGINIIGKWLYLYGSDGYVIRTDDLDTYEVITSVTTNKISGMATTNINGYPVIMAVTDTGTNDRIFSTAL